MNIAIYEPSGRISRTVSCPETLAPMQCMVGEQFVKINEDVTDTSHYVLGGTVTAKSALKYTVTIVGLVAEIAGLPPGLTVRCRGSNCVTDDHQLTIEFDIPGMYAVNLSGLPAYLDETIEVSIDD